jgi:hypothetical protein
MRGGRGKGQGEGEGEGGRGGGRGDSDRDVARILARLSRSSQRHFNNSLFLVARNFLAVVYCIGNH